MSDKDCTNCLYFDIETIYGVCNKHGVIPNSEKRFTTLLRFKAMA